MKYTSIFALLLLSNMSVAQNTFQGRIVDAVTDEPLANVNVFLTDKTIGTTTDVHGEFQLSIPDGAVTLAVKMIGYHEQQFFLPSQSLGRLQVKMMPVLVQLESVMITATREPSCVWDIPAFTSIISSSELEASTPATLGEALQKLAPTSVMSYGSYGAMETLSLRGSSIQQVLVLWDGQRMNSPLNGGLDLSTIPLQSIEKIEIVHGGYSSLYGADAMAGVVNLVTQSPLAQGKIKAAVHSTMGSFGLQKHEATLQQRLGPWSYLIAANQMKSENDFRYFLKNSDVALYRGNSNLDSYSLFGKVFFQHSRTTSVTVSSEMSSFKRGIPGSLTWPTVHGKQNDESVRHHLNIISQPAENWSLRIASFVHVNKTHYQDLNPSYPVNSQNNSSCPGVNVQSDLKMKEQTLILGASWLQERADGSDVGRHKRVNFAFFSNGNFKIHFLGNGLARLTPSLRYDSFSDFGGQVNPRIGVLISRKARSTAGVRMSWSKAFRAPTFNDLYWPEDMYMSGNPDLRPERATSFDIGLKARLPIADGLEFDGGYFHKDIIDLIDWNMDAVTYKTMPDNIKTAVVDGVEISCILRSFSGRLSTEVNYTHLNALNKSGLADVDGKRIPYRPCDSANLIASVKVRRIVASLGANYIGTRFTDEQNKDKLDSYLLLDGNMGIKPSFAGVQFDLMLSVKNIFDKEYIVVKDYPMPGRMVQVRVGMIL